MADARAVASYFVELADERGAGPFTPMQLLKLTYIAHGYSLGLQSTPLIENKVEAWKFGPVIPDLYHSIKEFLSHSWPRPCLTQHHTGHNCSTPK